MSKVTSIEHLNACAEAAKNFTNGIVGKIANTMVSAMEEMDNVKMDKTDAYTADEIDDLTTVMFSEIENIVETGSGTFNNASTSSVSFKSAKYTYQCVGNFVNLHIAIQLKASTGTIACSGIPFKPQKYSYGSCISDANVICRWNIYNNILEIKKSDPTGMWSHNDGETINFIATYEI